MYVPVKRVSSDVQMPEYQSEGASGFDLHAYMENSVFIEPRSINIIPTGLHFSIPSGYELQVRSRSGLAANQGVMVLNSPGTVDSDYRGEVKVILINLGNERVKITPGDRVAQGVVTSVEQVILQDIEKELKASARGSKGFGSTGK
jgi:dUTP pyrophosphatase